MAVVVNPVKSVPALGSAVNYSVPNLNVSSAGGASTIETVTLALISLPTVPSAMWVGVAIAVNSWDAMFVPDTVKVFPVNVALNPFCVTGVTEFIT